MGDGMATGSWIGPWRWMILVYRYDPDRDAAIVMRIFDGRSGSSPTST